MTNQFFKATNILCPKCSLMKLNNLNTMLICEGCGYYSIHYINKVKDATLVKVGNLVLNKPHATNYSKQYALIKK